MSYEQHIFKNNHICVSKTDVSFFQVKKIIVNNTKLQDIYCCKKYCKQIWKMKETKTASSGHTCKWYEQITQAEKS